MTAYLTELLISPVIGLPRSVVPFAAKSPASQPAHLLSNTVEPVKKYARVGRYRRRWEAQLPRRTKNSAVGDDEREGSKDRATASKMNMASSSAGKGKTSQSDVASVTWIKAVERACTEKNDHIVNKEPNLASPMETLPAFVKTWKSG
ncbi:unnamed protein product [Zymoseptoria tritici ST99CH_1E4]|uniref:Uncharacterized protein n=1 Tax=Zymoseptoria tritici ST99CH_1E4 TaxID=1276532 RepID=A0A2H1H9F8_ZYMTR|nr:unnamed protein product [Zymoseptoria tritici ST99CH_1E4]